MSIRLMTEVWDKAPYKQSDLLILLALADSANDDGVCWPSVPTLARRARVKDRQVRKALVRLEADGWLSREERVGRSTIYTVTKPEEVWSHRTASELETVPQDHFEERNGPTGQGVPQDRGAEPRSSRTGGGGPPGQGTPVLQDRQNHKEPPEEPPSSSSSTEIDFDGAWLGLVWRPRLEAMKHAAEHYPGVDLYAVTVQYIEYAMGKGWDLTSGYWLAQVKRQHDHENREQIGYDEAYDETVRKTREEAQRRWNEARGIE